MQNYYYTHPYTNPGRLLQCKTKSGVEIKDIYFIKCLFQVFSVWGVVVRCKKLGLRYLLKGQKPKKLKTRALISINFHTCARTSFLKRPNWFAAAVKYIKNKPTKEALSCNMGSLFCIFFSFKYLSLKFDKSLFFCIV